MSETDSTSRGRRPNKRATVFRSGINDHVKCGMKATRLDADSARPMGTRERLLHRVMDEVEDVIHEEPDAFDSTQESGTQMYRLQSTSHLYWHPDRWAIDFFFWLFRRSWSSLFVLAVTWYYVTNVVFTLLIVFASKLDGECVRVGGMSFGAIKGRSLWMDAFSLSWNTFSTVGYGTVYPALSVENEDSECVFIVFITSIEAFVGIMYAGFIAAIIFAKVTRIKQRAKVMFSDPVTIRFGYKGAGEQGDGDYDYNNAPQDKASEELQSANSTGRSKLLAKNAAKRSPFPILEFRIANENHSISGGEIITSKVNSVVIVESTKYDDHISEDLVKQVAVDRLKRRHDASTRAKLKKKIPMLDLDNSHTFKTNYTSGLLAGLSTVDDDTEVSLESSLSSPMSSVSAMENSKQFNRRDLMLANKRPSTRKLKIDDEIESKRIVPRMVFTNMKLEPSEHPLFKRIVRVKHVIDQDSPLLTAEAQKAITDNDGRWPSKWNNYQDVRKAIRFNQMVVSFTGISNISGAAVYSQKIYDFIDIVFGYQFVNALYEGRRHGDLKVDLHVINDVVEQPGGGGEPLVTEQP